MKKPEPQPAKCLCGYSLSGLPGSLVTCPECGAVIDLRLGLPSSPMFKWLDVLALAPWPALWIIDIVGCFGDLGYRNGMLLTWGIGVTVALSTSIFGLLCCIPSLDQTRRWMHMVLWWIAGNGIFTAAGLFWAYLSRCADV